MTEGGALPLEIDVQTVAKKRDAGESFVLLDVREQIEFNTASVEGSCLIPMSEISERLDELEQHRNQPIVVMCHHGMRSMQVTQALRQAGFDQAQSMAGGIDQWSEQIDASVPRY